ncbi:MAG TPA: hypothetical protein VFX98_14605 [Longimicrobiaceae bacterium]|nr:hypothetical protein [Longimicrobiaceae bacterium]
MTRPAALLVLALLAACSGAARETASEPVAAPGAPAPADYSTVLVENHTPHLVRVSGQGLAARSIPPGQSACFQIPKSTARVRLRAELEIADRGQPGWAGSSIIVGADPDALVWRLGRGDPGGREFLELAEQRCS